MNSRNSVLSILTLTALTALLVSCNNWYFSPQKDWTKPSEIVFSEDAPLDFNMIQKTALASCVQCHSGQNSPTLMSYDDVHANLQKVTEEVGQGDMPPKGSSIAPLTACQKDLLQAWVAGGAAQFSNSKVGHITNCSNFFPPPPPDTTPIELLPLNFKSIEQRILIPKCIICHNADNTHGDAHETLLSPLSIMLDEQIIGVTAEQSKLYLISKPEGRMPPKKSKVKPLTVEELSLLKRWIDAGHPE